MKAQLIALFLCLLSNILVAQFSVKLTLDDNGVYAVLLKSEKMIGDPVVGSGQFTITAPFGGFEVGALSSVSGVWNPNVEIITRNEEPAIAHDYFLIEIIDGDGIGKGGISIGEEITLFTFRNTGVCTGPAELITSNDPLITKANPEIKGTYTVNNDLSTFDASTGILHKIARVYGVGSAVCDSSDVYVLIDSVAAPIDSIIPEPMDSTLILPDTLIGASTDFDFSVILNDSGVYEVKVRPNVDLQSPILGSGLVTLSVPHKGFIVDNLQSIFGKWELQQINRPIAAERTDYLIFRLKESITLGQVIDLERMSENTLFTFENAGICTGPIDLISPSDAIWSLHSEDFKVKLDFNIYDLTTGELHDSIGRYNEGMAVCNLVELSPYDSANIKEPGFLFKLERDADGLFTVTAKSTLNFPELVVGSIQVSIVAPEGGIEVTDFTGYVGVWDHFILNKAPLYLEDDYLFFGLRGPFDLKNTKVGDEIKLLSFRNGAECIGPISLLQPEDPIAAYPEINSGHDMSVIDEQTFKTYHFITTYGLGAIDCQDANSDVDSTNQVDEMVVTIEETSARNANIMWTPVDTAISYELEVRIKGAENWNMAEKLNTKTTKAYFYGPENQAFEGRVTTFYEDGTQSISEIFNLNLLDTSTNN